MEFHKCDRPTKRDVQSNLVRCLWKLEDLARHTRLLLELGSLLHRYHANASDIGRYFLAAPRNLRRV